MAESERNGMIGKPNLPCVKEFLNGISWMFQINGYEKTFILADHDEDKKAAEVTIDTNYQRIDIKLFPCFFNHDVHEQRKCLLHELCHTITAPAKLAMHNLLDGKLITPDRIHDINEESTSKIENMLHNLMTGNLVYAKQAYADYLKPKKKRKK